MMNLLRHLRWFAAVGVLGSASAAGPNFSANLATPKGMAADDGTAKIFLRVFSWEAEAKDYQLRQRVTGWDGQEVKVWPPENFRFEGEWKRQVELRLPRFGSYRYTAELWDGKSLVAEASRRITWVPAMPERSRDERWNSFIGINSHQWADWKMFDRLGIYWARDYSWQWYGRGDKGVAVPQGENFQSRLAAAHAAGVNTLPCIQKAFVTPDKQKWMEGTEEISAIFRRISDDFPEQKVFQIGNEEEAKFPGHVHEAANYSNFIAHAAKGLDAAGHGAKVILSGDVFMHDDLMVALLAGPARDAFLASCIHIYTGTIPPEIATRDTNAGSEDRGSGDMILDRLREYTARLKAAGKETWMTETGWDVTYGPAVGERLQAVYLPRMFLLTRWAGVDKTFWFFDLDGKGTNRFDSSGLVDLEGNLRPSGAALAAFSRLALGAGRAGSLYLGSEDIWAPVWKMPGGRWLVTAWAVKDTHPVPPALAGAREAYDMFANKISPSDGRITDEVRYWIFDALPPAFEAQRLVELDSRRMVSVPVGGSFTVSLQAAPAELGKSQGAGSSQGARASRPCEALPSDTNSSLQTGGTPIPPVGCNLSDRTPAGSCKTEFSRVPPVFSPGAWKQEAGKSASVVAVANDAAPGRYEIELRASGDGWEKRWTIRVEVLPAILATAAPFAGGGSEWVELRRSDGSPFEGSVSIPENFGSVEPSAIAAAAGEAAKVRFNAAPGATGPAPLAITLKDGIRQTAFLRPLALALPRAGKISVDGDLSDWPALLPTATFATNRLDFQAAAALAWSPEGIHIAAKMPVEKVFSSDPAWFWSYQNLEIFLKTSAEAGDTWTADCHQFFLVPVEKNGTWRLVAGEWKKRSDAKAENIFDDSRIQTAMRQENGFLIMEAFIPSAALGATPARGAAWRAALAMQTGSPGQMDIKACWPRPKSDGILDRPSTWGIFQLE